MPPIESITAPLSFILMILVGILGFFLRAVMAEIKEHRDKIQDLEVALPTHYMNKQEMKEIFDRLFTELTEIKKILNLKEDKKNELTR